MQVYMYYAYCNTTVTYGYTHGTTSTCGAQQCRAFDDDFTISQGTKHDIQCTYVYDVVPLLFIVCFWDILSCAFSAILIIFPRGGIGNAMPDNRIFTYLFSYLYIGDVVTPFQKIDFYHKMIFPFPKFSQTVPWEYTIWEPVFLEETWGVLEDIFS